MNSLLLKNARVFGNPGADSVLLSGDRIVAVGRNLDDAGGAVRDLGGAFLTPGINDAHIHFARGARDLEQVGLYGAQSPEEMQRRIAARVAETPAGQWITGRGWDHTLWPGAPWPTRAMLDAVSTRHPMYFTRVDLHVAVANSAALQAAGVNAATPDPPAGSLDFAAGLLRETAMSLVRRAIPPASPASRRAALLRALQQAASLGITSIQDNSFWTDFEMYRELDREGRLTLRVTEWLDFSEPVEALEERRRAACSPRLKLGLVKGFSDGSLGARTAALLEPYSDDPATRGMLRMDAAEMGRKFAALDAAGFQIGLHAIGDAAVRACLDAFERVPRSPRRHRIEHAQIVTEEDVARFALLGLIASVQPNHWLTDRRWAGDRLGARLRTAYRWRSFARQGVPLAVGTDFPVEPMDPRRGLHALVSRDDGEGLTMSEALDAYTAGSAYAEFSEHDKGRIAPGQLADLCAWDRDLLAASPEEVLEVRVVLTVAGGAVVFG